MKKTLLTTLSLAVLTSCGGGGGGGDGSTTLSFASSEYFPSGLAISSPTASTGSSSFSALIKKSLQPKNLSIDPEADFATKAEALADLAAAEGGSCTFSLPNFNSPGDPTCYGPQLWYINHLDWTGSGNLGTEGDNNAANLPGGDLGIWSASEAGGEACASAKVNTSISNIASKTDAALSVIAAVSCIANTNSLALNVGDIEDLTTELDTALTDTDYSVSSATIERLDDTSSGNEINKISITILKNGNAFLQLELKHSPDSSDASLYEGILSVLQNKTIEAQDHGFSLIYKQTSSNLDYQLRYADFDATPSFSSMFNNGILKINQADPDGGGPQNAWDNFSQTSLSRNLSTEKTLFNYSWQAGVQDSHTRVFQLTTEKSGSVSTGIAFFGFGDNFDQSSGDTTDGQLKKFICNWAGPGQNHTTFGLDEYAQKQTIQTNSSGVFEEVSSNISYAPVNSCNMTASQNNTDVGNANTNKEFWYWTGTQNNPPGGASAWDAADYAQPAVNNDLVDISDPSSGYSTSDIPTAPTLSF
jgi:hypothetical protein